MTRCSLTAACVLLLVAGCGQQPTAAPMRASDAPPTASSPQHTMTARVAAPMWTLPNLDGVTQRLEDYRGQIVLLNFWATWCPPCLEELPDLARLHHAYQAHGVTVVGVAVDTDGAQAVQAFVQRMGIPYPIMLGDIETAQRYRVFGIPASFLIDRAGRVVKRWNGPRDESTFAQQLDALLAEEPK